MPHWIAALGKVGTGQIAVQAIGFASGLLVIRLLPPSEYALYTLALVMLGTVTVLADCGIASAVMAHAGQAWQNREQLGKITNTGLTLRRRFGIASIALSLPVLILLLLQHGASWRVSLLLSVVTLLTFASGLSASILEVAPKLHQRIGALQSLTVAGNAGRLALLTATLTVAPSSLTAIAVAGATQLWVSMRLRRLNWTLADLSQNEDPHIRKELLTTVKRIVPGAIYFCFSGQITIWLLSIYGSTRSVADVGALTRITQILSIISVIGAQILAPRFARLPSDSRQLTSTFLSFLALPAAGSVTIFVLVALLPQQTLQLLGANYKGLEQELTLIVGSSCLSAVVSTAYSLLSARAWIPSSIWVITSNVAMQALGLLIFDVSSVAGAVNVSLLTATWNALLYSGFGIWKAHTSQLAYASD